MASTESLLDCLRSQSSAKIIHFSDPPPGVIREGPQPPLQHTHTRAKLQTMIVVKCGYIFCPCPMGPVTFGLDHGWPGAPPQLNNVCVPTNSTLGLQLGAANEISEVSRKSHFLLSNLKPISCTHPWHRCSKPHTNTAYPPHLISLYVCLVSCQENTKAGIR